LCELPLEVLADSPALAFAYHIDQVVVGVVGAGQVAFM